MDTLGIEPRASRMLSGCDTTTPRALGSGAPAHNVERAPAPPTQGHDADRTLASTCPITVCTGAHVGGACACLCGCVCEHACVCGWPGRVGAMAGHVFLYVRTRALVFMEPLRCENGAACTPTTQKRQAEASRKHSTHCERCVHKPSAWRQRSDRTLKRIGRSLWATAFWGRWVARRPCWRWKATCFPEHSVVSPDRGPAPPAGAAKDAKAPCCALRWGTTSCQGPWCTPPPPCVVHPSLACCVLAQRALAGMAGRACHKCLPRAAGRGMRVGAGLAACCAFS